MTDALYGPELARVHDARFGDLARAAAARMVSLLREAGHAGGRVADLGCGGGIACRVLADAGHPVVAVDASAAQLALVAARVPEAERVRAAIRDAALPPCAGVMAVGEVVGYVVDGRAEVDDPEGLADRLVAPLVPGGVLLLDVATPGREPAGWRRARFGGDGWVLHVEAEERGDTVTRRIRVEVTDPDGTPRIVDEHHVVRLIDPAVIGAALGERGLRVRVRDAYAPEVRIRSGHAVLEAVRGAGGR